MNLPEDFIKKYTQLLGDEAPAFLASFDQPEYSGFRINPLRASLPKNVDLSQPVPYTKWGYYGKVTGHTVAHQSGAVYSQEPSAMFVGETAHPVEGDRVLDLSAAPGGKTTHLGSFLNNTGLLVSNEIMPKRAKVLSENVERFGLTNTLVLNETPEVIAKHFPAYFDKIVVDVPCSGEGMFRKDPEAISYWSLDYPKACAERQRMILAEAVKTIKPGGELVYSTCTFAPEEDEQIIAWLLETYPQFEIVPIDKPAGIVDGRPNWADGNPDLAGTARLFPHLMKGEGHFVAKLRLNAPLVAEQKVRTETSHTSKEESLLFKQFVAETLSPAFQYESKRLLTFGEQLYYMPDHMPRLEKLRVVRPGLHLGTLKKGRIEPSYALGLALKPEEIKQKLEITPDEWQLVVHGDIFKRDDLPIKKGWVRLVCEDQPIVFAKVVGNTVKNFFPKGLRFKV
ncbi:RNA methyltransferase [Secundilactobacillus paracollinoides]|uniref:RsmB/NOP family class I SAM-dependent RNA methyltransferase n=1 Tax=Secundilactobacillus paracollinoides TaxID=240427 RepID=UPI00081AACA4|nr:RsmF rRNA methyltransferase first C-terminal domain-containing protein [Secundilactobacillus paracollinoides]ANZ63786.1 RNA methyltransferase [Secundilactobacillus paracollinoides]